MWALADVSRATGAPSGLLLSWLDRRIVEMRAGDVDARTSGIPRRFSLRRVLQIGIAHRLTSVGLGASYAAEVATRFTDAQQPTRKEGVPFEAGRTMLAVSDTGAVVINTDTDPRLSEVRQCVGHDADTLVLVDLNRVVDQTVRALPRAT